MLNIKDPVAHELAKELAAIEHTTMTEAVVRALRASLAEHATRRRLRREILDAEIASARAQGLSTNEDPFADLYDPDTGLSA